MDIISNTNDVKNFNYLTIQKMALIYNALEDGWTVKKKENKYIFIKNHRGKKEVYLDDYLKKFMTENLDINKIN
jgi:nucleoid-associated protein YejK|tara:strand:- start:147 stop:368 length:222 start_codon:yes stop_codon:yes gene_type:complete